MSPEAGKKIVAVFTTRYATLPLAAPRIYFPPEVSHLASPWLPLATELELELIQTQMTQKPTLRAKGECACVAQMGRP